METTPNPTTKMTKQQFKLIETEYFKIKKVFDEGGLSNQVMKIWNEIYENSCHLISNHEIMEDDLKW